MPALGFAAPVAAAVLAVVHVITPSLHFLEGTPRSAWLSIAGGVAVAYVFVHLLPELAESLVTEVSKAAIAVLVAFLAGGVILNVLKEEVPSERQGVSGPSRSAPPAMRRFY